MNSIAAYIAVFIGVHFLSASWSKLRGLESFREILEEYPLRPRWIGPLTIAVPLAEGFVGLVLLSLHPRLLGWAVPAAMAFIGMATLVVGLRLARGEKRFRCGCGGDLSEERSAPWLIFQNVMLLGAIAAALPGSRDGLVSTTGIAAYLVGGGLDLASKLTGALVRAQREMGTWKPAG